MSMRRFIVTPTCHVSTTHGMAQDQEEKVVGEYQGVKYKKQDGVLVVTSLRVAWSRGGQTFDVNYPYQQIKGRNFNMSQGWPEPERDLCMFFSSSTYQF